MCQVPGRGSRAPGEVCQGPRRGHGPEMCQRPGKGVSGTRGSWVRDQGEVLRNHGEVIRDQGEVISDQGKVVMKQGQGPGRGVSGTRWRLSWSRGQGSARIRKPYMFRAILNKKRRTVLHLRE